MTQPITAPPVLFRDAESARILELIRATFGPDGALRPGARVHLAVTAPQRGGLSVFLAELARAAAADKRLFPVRVVVENPATWEQELGRAVGAILAEVGTGGSGSAPEALLPSSAVVAAARALWASKRLVTLLILDLGAGLRRLTTLADDQAGANPLVEFLRAVVNLAEDGEAPLALIGGWGDDVRLALQRWRRDDVAQRFFPVVPLWPNFGREDAVGVWACYRAILTAHGFETAGDYPGFARSRDPVPIGEVLDRLHSARQSRADGLFFIDLLRQRHPNPDPAARDLDQTALAALCLEDRVVADGMLLPVIQGGFGSWVEPAEGGLRATPELYAQFGLLPPRTVVGLREQVLFRLGQGNDPELAAEILAGVAAFLAVPSDPAPIPSGGFATGTFRITTRLPAWASAIRVVGFAYLGQAHDPVLAQEVAAEVRRAEEDPNGRAGRLVLVLLRANGPRVALLRAVGEELAKSGEPVPVIKSGLAHEPSRPVVLAVLEVNDEQAIDAVGRARGEPRPPEHLPALRDWLTEHFKDAERVLPPLVPGAFVTGTLNALQQRSHLALDRQLVHDALPSKTPPTGLAAVTQACEALERLRAVEKVGRGRYRWTYSTDALLAELREALPAPPDKLFERLARTHMIDHPTWQGLHRELLGAYRDFLTENADAINARQPRPQLTQRLGTWCEGLGTQIQELHNRGETVRAAELRAWLTRVEGQLNDPNADLNTLGEQLAALTADVEQARAEAETAVTAARQRVLDRLEEIAQDELLDERKTESQQLRDRAQAGGRAELESLEREVEALAGRVERDRALADSNRQAEAELRRRFTNTRQRLNDASDKLSATEHPRAAELAGKVDTARGALERLQTELENQFPGGPTARSTQLTRLGEQFVEFVDTVRPSTEEINTATRPRTLRPRLPKSPPPAPGAETPPSGADTREPRTPPSVPPVATPSSGTGRTPTQRPGPPSAPVAPVAPPPVIGADVGPVVGPPSPPGPTEREPIPEANEPQLKEPEPVPVVVVGSDPAPARPEVARPEAPGTEQARTFTGTESDLMELLNLLNSPARILAAEVVPNAADN
jgi:hypothetical protein